MSSNTTIQIGEQGDIFAKRYPSQIRIDRQPAGLTFYDVDWKTSAPGTVSFEHGKHALLIEYVLSVSGTQDANYPEEGMSEIDIISGITASDLISHDEARLKMFAILQKIAQAGWSIFIDRGDPRLRGKDAFNYVMAISPFSTLDASYLPTFDEWMHIKSGMTWRFYADHVYLEVNFTREHTLTDPTKPGAYIVNFNIKNESEHYRAYVGPDNRKRWKELLPGALAKLVPMRAEAEAKMTAKGFKIDETYQDPPVPDLK